jgi:tRNA nucleotidyltransferase (CCA-adding enzyme)
VRQELEKTMEQVRAPSRALARWRTSGALAALIPGLVTQPEVAFQAADHVALPDATENVGLASSRKLNRLTTLFLGVEPRHARRVLRELRFSNREVEWMAHIVACWKEMEPGMREGVLSGAGVPDRDLRQWAAGAGRTVLRDLLRVTVARWAAEDASRHAAAMPRRPASLYRRALQIAFRDPVSVDDLAVDGDDLIDAGIPPGPRLGAVLRWLLQQVLEEPARNTRDALLDLVTRASPPDQTGATSPGRR